MKLISVLILYRSVCICISRRKKKEKKRKLEKKKKKKKREKKIKTTSMPTPPTPPPPPPPFYSRYSKHFTIRKAPNVRERHTVRGLLRLLYVSVSGFVVGGGGDSVPCRSLRRPPDNKSGSFNGGSSNKISLASS